MRRLVSNFTGAPGGGGARSEEHTSELQSQSNLVCRLLLEKKKKNNTRTTSDSNNYKQRPNVRQPPTFASAMLASTEHDSLYRSNTFTVISYDTSYTIR